MTDEFKVAADIEAATNITVGDGTTSLDYLVHNSPWVGKILDAKDMKILRLEQENKELVTALMAVNSILWMAEKYADAGGLSGPERREYEAAVAVFNAVLTKLPKGV